MTPQPTPATPLPQRSLPRVLDSFGRTRLLTFDNDPVTRRPTVEVSHEALLREWPRLRGWLSEARGEVRLQRQLAQAASEWRAAQHDPSFLLTGARLAQFEGWLTSNTLALTTEEQSLVAASLVDRERRAHEEAARQAREMKLERRARRVLQAFVGVFLVAALVAGGLAWWANDRREAALAAEQQAVANLDLSEAQRLAAESNRLFIEGRDFETAALLAMRSVGLANTPQGDEALSRAARQIYPIRMSVGHTGLAIAFTADGRRMVAGDSMGYPRVWDVETGAILLRLEGSSPGGYVDMTADGRWIATAAFDGTVRVWDGAIEKEVYKLEYEPEISGVDISSDGRLLLITNWDATVRIVELASGVERIQLTHPASVLAGTFSPDDRLVLTGDTDGHVRLWDWQSSTLVLDLPLRGWPWALGFAPDMSTFGVGSYDKVAYIFETATGRLLHEILHDDEPIRTLDYTSDSSTMVTADQRGVAHFWDVQTGKEARRFIHSTSVGIGGLTPDGRYLATLSDDQIIRFWDLLAQPVQLDIPGAGHSEGKLAFTRDGSTLFSQGRVFDSHTGAPGPDTEAVGFSGISRDGGTAFVVVGKPYAFRILDPLTWETRLSQPVTCPSEPYGVGISPDGSLIALGGFTSPYRICVYDTRTGEMVQEIENYGINCSIAFSLDSRILLAGDCGDHTYLFDVATGSLIRSLKMPGAPHCVNDVALSPDGTQVVTVGMDGLVGLWELETGELVRMFVGHTDAVFGGAFSPDGRYLLTGSGDGTARLWELASGIELRRLMGHTTTVWRVAFSPDGHRMATTSSDESVKLWLTDLAELRSAVCGSLIRDFTDDMRQRYGIVDDGPTCARFVDP